LSIGEHGLRSAADNRGGHGGVTVNESNESLSWKQKRVVDNLRTVEYATLGWLARKCFPGVRPVKKANSWVRNSVRKPVRLGLIERVKPGVLRAAVRS
jgi:hypothetical protein